MKSLTRLFLFAVCAVISIQALAFSGGGQDGNGGDFQEPLFKDIAQNIADWIIAGNSVNLKLPGVGPALYKEKMLKKLSRFHIQFTDDKVFVGEIEKTCKNWIDKAKENQILCNSPRFARAQTAEQYRLVHHEFAGLAGLEENQNQDSDYRISKQISAHLRAEMILRLPIVATSTAGQPIFMRFFEILDRATLNIKCADDQKRHYAMEGEFEIHNDSMDLNQLMTTAHGYCRVRPDNTSIMSVKLTNSVRVSANSVQSMEYEGIKEFEGNPCGCWDFVTHMEAEVEKHTYIQMIIKEDKTIDFSYEYKNPAEK